MPTAKTVIDDDHETLLAIFRVLSNYRVEPTRIIAGSLRLLGIDDGQLTVELENITYDRNGAPIPKEDGGFESHPRTFRIPLGYEVVEDGRRP